MTPAQIITIVFLWTCCSVLVGIILGCAIKANSSRTVETIAGWNDAAAKLPAQAKVGEERTIAGYTFRFQASKSLNTSALISYWELLDVHGYATGITFNETSI